MKPSNVGLVGEARLAAGHVGLLGLPLLGGAFVGDGLDSGQALGAAHGADGLVDKALLRGSGSHRK